MPSCHSTVGVGAEVVNTGTLQPIMGITRQQQMEEMVVRLNFMDYSFPAHP
jgi:hypothetical protein